ncbi:MAG: FAD-dependent monooxygenase [Pseudolabrys sp.]
MASERHVIVAGAGMAGLTAALALAHVGLRATVFEQAPRLSETGAGLQLGPNATRVLLALGLGPRLAPVVTVPEAIRVMSAGSAREIARIPLGRHVEARYGAPYWALHRGDLQAALAGAANDEQDIEVSLGVRVEDFAAHVNGVTVLTRRGQEITNERGMALIGADGVWSQVRERLHRQHAPSFSHRTAWRALVPAEAVAPEFREPLVHLWLGLDAHLVHYPVKGGSVINIVGIVHDEWNKPGWSAPGKRDEILRHYARYTWSERARELVGLPERWLKWALFERRTPFRGGAGPVTLIGDAAHPMLPFLAQGAGMAIEDAAVIADCLVRYRGAGDALRHYEAARAGRTQRVREASRKQGKIYGMSGPEALVRNLGMRLLGGDRLLARQDWLYGWTPPERFRGA